MRSTRIEEAFAARQDAAMIRTVDDDGVIRESVRLKLSENFTDFGVHALDRIGVSRVSHPHLWKIRMVGV